MTENTPSRFLLIWLDREASISSASIRPIRRAIEDQVDRAPKEVEIDVWLDSSGGDANAAYKLALILRRAATTVRIVVPDYAKSAATLLSLAGDSIYLGPGAELGPLDAQMPEEGSVAGYTSALNIARAADAVAQDAVGMAVQGGADLLFITGLSRAQTIDAMLRFSAEFSEPLVRQLDPKLVHHAKQMLKVTARYAERLLQMTGCEYPEHAAGRLVEDFPTHGFIIDLEEAKDLGLPVFPIADYEHLAVVRAAQRKAEAGHTVISFGTIDDAVRSGDDDDNENSQDEQGGERDEHAGADEKPDGLGGFPNGAEAVHTS